MIPCFNQFIYNFTICLPVRRELPPTPYEFLCPLRCYSVPILQPLSPEDSYTTKEKASARSVRKPLCFYGKGGTLSTLCRALMRNSPKCANLQTCKPATVVLRMSVCLHGFRGFADFLNQGFITVVLWPHFSS